MLKTDKTVSKNIFFELVILIVNEVTHISYEKMSDKLKGERNISDARMIAMYLCSVYLLKSSVEIGRLFNRDHSTVLHALKTIKHRMDANDEAVMAKLNPAIQKIETIIQQKQQQ